MKKSLIALAVLSVSGVAMAQSSVTLYGVADAGIGKIKYNSAGTGSTDAHGKTELISGGSTLSNGPSRLGVKGVEDIGGGLQAGFNFETGINLNNGGNENSGGGGDFWGRQANMWLTGSQWGTIKLGRQFTPSYLNALGYDLVGTANYNLQSIYTYGGEVSARANSAIAYVTPTFSGVTGVVAYILKQDVKNSYGINKAAWDIAALYANGPIAGGLSVNKIADSRTNFLLGGRYNFGSFIVAASYAQASKPGTKARRRGVGIGGTALFGPFSVTLDLMRDTKNEWTGGATGKKYTNGLVEVKYNLSKRTFLYGVYLRRDGDYNGTVAGLPATVHGSTNNYALGVRHNF